MGKRVGERRPGTYIRRIRDGIFAISSVGQAERGRIERRISLGLAAERVELARRGGRACGSAFTSEVAA